MLDPQAIMLYLEKLGYVNYIDNRYIVAEDKGVVTCNDNIERVIYNYDGKTSWILWSFWFVFIKNNNNLNNMNKLEKFYCKRNI